MKLIDIYDNCNGCCNSTKLQNCTDKTKHDLLKYFEGLPLNLVRHIIREFERTTLEESSIVTPKVDKNS